MGEREGEGVRGRGERKEVCVLFLSSPWTSLGSQESGPRRNVWGVGSDWGVMSFQSRKQRPLEATWGLQDNPVQLASFLCDWSENHGALVSGQRSAEPLTGSCARLRDQERLPWRRRGGWPPGAGPVLITVPTTFQMRKRIEVDPTREEMPEAGEMSASTLEQSMDWNNGLQSDRGS